MSLFFDMTDFPETTIFRPPDYKSSDFQKKNPVLTFVGGTQVGRRVLLAHDSITLGRSPDATIMIRDSAVSRLHIEIGYDPLKHAYVVKDMGSSNGTLLNNKRISDAVLGEGDKIIIGQTVLRFSRSDAIDVAFH